MLVSTRMSWETIGQKKPRRKPVNKRKVVDKPAVLSSTEEVIFDFLAKQYPNPQTCEDIFAELVKKRDDCDSLKKLWAVLDSKDGRLKDVCIVKEGPRYVLDTQE
jgi:hypothetical protein